MEKSFGELLTDSFAVIKKSYIDLLKICGVFLGCGLLGLITMYLVMGKDFIMNMQNQAYVQNYFNTHPRYAIFVLLLSLFYFILTYVSYSWMALVVRNNILTDKSLLKEAFFESVKKFWRIFLAVFLMGAAYLIIFLIGILALIFLFSKEHAILGIIVFILSFFAFLILILPSGFTIFTGVLCRNGKFWSIFWESLVLGFKKWFKIVGYMILIFLICGAIMGISAAFVSGILMALHLDILAIITYYIIQTIFGLFLFCFYTVFYLDIAGIKPQTEKLIDTNQVNQINQGQIMP